MRTWWVAPLYPVDLSLNSLPFLLHVLVLSNSYWPSFLSSFSCQHLSCTNWHAEVFPLYLERKLSFQAVTWNPWGFYLVRCTVIAVPSCQIFSVTVPIVLKRHDLWKLIGVECIFSSSICLKGGCLGNICLGRDVINSLWFDQSHSSSTSIFLSLERKFQPTTNGTGPRRVLGSAATLNRRHQHEVWWALPTESQQLATPWETREEGDLVPDFFFFRVTQVELFQLIDWVIIWKTNLQLNW